MENQRIDRQLVRAFIEASEADLQSAGYESAKKSYHNSVYHAQQAAEKICKAVLIIHQQFQATHIVSPLIEKLKEKLPSLAEIIPALKELERHWLMSRYPIRTGKEIWNPVHGFTREDATDAIKKAEQTMTVCKQYLNDQLKKEDELEKRNKKKKLLEHPKNKN
ncbi:MAG: HEPN domain-containing protein [Candidatus Woesearchaeota archaeon]|nr:HEPN domain-containing protein [Candidatus Woesearchaeota archaeon]